MRKCSQIPVSIVLLAVTSVQNCRGQSTPSRVRAIPLCVTVDTVKKYRGSVSDLLSNTITEASSPTTIAVQTNCTNCGTGADGLLSGISYGVIETSPELLPDEVKANEEYLNYKELHQWLHLKIEFRTPVSVVIVQAMANPYGLPWGVFDLQFACTDCASPQINIEDGKENFALDYKGSASVVPCTRRAYIHPRHPYVYVYSGPAQVDFHLNYNFVDTHCRNMTMLQFLIISANDARKEFARTAVIDHINQDSIDGMPYPYHVRFHKTQKCHSKQRYFLMVAGGDKAGITVNNDYDQCVQASDADFDSKYKDKTYYISDWVCNRPERIQCKGEDFEPRSTPNDGTHQTSSGAELCVRSQDLEVPLIPAVSGLNASSPIVRILIERSEFLRRFHGLCMILGFIALPLVSIHVARYFKETQGCCLLIGWWFWVHLILTYIGTGAILTGLVLGIFMPPRIETMDFPALATARQFQMLLHNAVGLFTILIPYAACLIVGPIRPRNGKKRMIFIWAHTILGYLVVGLAIIGTVFSTACFEVTVHVGLMVGTAVIPYVAGFGIQVVMDFKKPSDPPRKYFPVIEAIFARSPLPMAIPRFCVLALAVVTTAIFFICIILFGGYKGAFGFSICNNCYWKRDAFVPVDDKDPRSGYHSVWGLYNCARTVSNSIRFGI